MVGNANIEHLETIMGEFREAIVICDPFARILLFNPQAKKLFRHTEALNLGYSFWGVCHLTPFEHAFRSLQRSPSDSGKFRFGREDTERWFVCATVKDALLLHCHVRFVAAKPFSDSVYILTFTDIPRQIDPAALKGNQLSSMIEEMRRPLANLRVAAENLQAHSEMTAAERREFEKIITDESADLIRHFESVVIESRAVTYTQWPLTDVYSADLTRCVARELNRKNAVAVTLTGVPLWLQADAHSLMLTLEFLVMAVHAACNVSEIDIDVQSGERGVYFDIVWQGQPLPQETVALWIRTPLPDASEGMTVADVLRRHNSDLWSQPHRRQGYALLRLPAPAAQSQWEPEAKALPERPALYDPSLYDRMPVPATLSDAPLSSLQYVVFDTETTGLRPAEGDEILSMAGVRIVKGRILADEIFCSLVNPQRSVPESSLDIHGITAEMLRGKPPITVVLPEFRSFVGDAVLVAHNGAFDMQFIQLKEEKAEVQFHNTVLDSQLLSMVVDSEAADHSLAAISQRLGVPMRGRHTALGDCWITAQVFVALLDLLERKGITSIGQALAASQRVLELRK